MQSSRHFTMRLPVDLHRWLEDSYYKRGCATKTDYVLQLITKGIQAEAIDDTVARIQNASTTGPVVEMLRQTLAVRYIVEQQAKGKVSMTEKLSTDALVWADQELKRLFPDRSAS